MPTPFHCADPASLGFDSERLARIPEFLQSTYVGNGRLPMTQLVVARDKQPVFYDAQGKMGENRENLRHDAIFRIASMTA